MLAGGRTEARSGGGAHAAPGIGLRVAPSVWRVIVAGTVAAALALAAAILLGQPGAGAPAPTSRVHAGAHALAPALPGALDGAASAVLGAGAAGYSAHLVPGGITAANHAQRLSARFTRAGVSIAAPRASVRLRAAAIGFGAALSPLGAVAPAARGSRVVYSRPGLREWYSNGPLGVEQGFTVARAPAVADSGPLTIALSLSTSARPVLASGRRSVSFYAGSNVALRYDDISALDASGRRLQAWMGLAHGRLLLRVDARGARYPIRIDPLAQNGAEFENPGEFGYSVAISEDGTTALIGAPNDGRVYVFGRSAGGWSEVTKLTDPGSTANGFGHGVALSADGDTAIVGAPNAGEGSIGTAYMFTRSGSTWSYAAQISCELETEEENCHHFGTQVSVSGDGDTALLGGGPTEAAESASVTWAFVRAGDTWTQQGEPLVEAEGASPQHSALSDDGSTALVAGRIFIRSEGIWTEQANEGESAGGMALSSDGDTAVIAGGETARFFVRSEGSWSQQGEAKLGGGGNEDSAAVSADGTTALIGAPGRQEAGVYTRSEGHWSAREYLHPTVPAQEIPQKAGFSVALSGSAGSAVLGGPAFNEYEATTSGEWFFAEPVAPTASTAAASSVGAGGATLNGTVNPNGFEVTSCEFEWGATEAYGHTAPCSPPPGAGTGGVAVAAAISGLSRNTTYHFRVVATNAGGSADGSDETVQTLPKAPEVRTEAPFGEITASSATLPGTVNPEGGLVTSCEFEYGTTEAYGSAVPCTPSPGAGSQPVSVTARLAGLAHSTHYHYRLSATNAGGTSVTLDREFVTKAAELPTVGTPTAEELTPTSATVVDTVDPNGSAVTECEFAVRASGGTGSGTMVKCEPEPGSGESPVAVHAHVTGLTPGVEYSVALQALNGGGPEYSRLHRFTLPTLTPVFGRCLKVLGNNSAFSNPTCTTHSPSAKYEFAPGPGADPAFTTALKTGVLTLEGASKTSKVVCSHMAGGGEVTGLQTIVLAMTLSGCESNGHPCATAGHASGEVLLGGITGTLGVVTTGKTAVADKLGLTLSGTAEFECAGGSIDVSLAGTAIGTIAPTNAMKTIRTWKFSHTKQVEKPERFEGGPPQQLEWTFGGAGPAPVGLGMEATFTTPEAIEIDSVS